MEKIIREEGPSGPADAIPVLYRDEALVAVDKPAGLLVHRTRLSPDRRVCMTLVRDQIGQKVYPVHRLDRKTGGVLLFGLGPEVARALGEQFAGREVRKVYLACVRGWPAGPWRVEQPLSNDGEGELQEASTTFVPLGQAELPHPVGAFPTGRYAMVSAEPHTGRWHQVRRHLNHSGHPIIGDTSHGDARHNRIFRSELDCHGMFLHAHRIAFEHPGGGGRLEVEAPLGQEFAQLCTRFGWPREAAFVDRATLAAAPVVASKLAPPPDPGGP